MLDQIVKKNREPDTRSERSRVPYETSFFIRPSLLMKIRSFLSGIYSRYFKRKVKTLSLDHFDDDESTSDYILNLTVWTFVTILALFSGAFQIFFILAYIYEY
jgi:hypothetical protein